MAILLVVALIGNAIDELDGSLTDPSDPPPVSAQPYYQPGFPEQPGLWSHGESTYD